MATDTGDYRERIVLLDLARALAIVIMVFQHAVLIYATDQGEHSVLGKAVLLLGTAPAAPVFLFIMGIFLTRPEVDLRRGLGRGLKLIALGYLLNLLRSTLPSIVAGQDALILKRPDSPLTSFWVIDILQMAGLSYLLLTLLKIALPWRWGWAVLAVAIGFVSPLLWQVGGPSGVYALWGAGKNVFFPLFPWIVYPLAGMVYGLYLLEVEEHSRATRAAAIVGGLLLAVGVATCLLPAKGRFGPGGYFRNGPGAQLAVVGFILAWLRACDALAGRWTGSRGLGLLCFWSRHVTAVYFVQWVVIGWSVLILGRNRYASPVAVVLGAGVLLVAHLAVRAWVWRETRVSEPDGFLRRRDV